MSTERAAFFAAHDERAARKAEAAEVAALEQLLEPYHG